MDDDHGPADELTEQEGYLRDLVVTDPLRKDILHDVIREMGLPMGSHGLDVGCGIGTQCMMLAEAVGPSGHVTGIDLSTLFVEYAKDRPDKSRTTGRTDFLEGDMNALPFGDGSFDWAWSMDCVGYHQKDPFPALKEMVRVVGPLTEDNGDKVEALKAFVEAALGKRA